MSDDTDILPDLPPPQSVDIGHGRLMWISRRPDLYPSGHIAIDMPNGPTRWFSSERIARAETAPKSGHKVDGRRGIRSPRIAAALAELGTTPRYGEITRVARKFGIIPANLNTALKRHSSSGAI